MSTPCEGPCNRRWRDAQASYQESLSAWESADANERGDRPEIPEVQCREGDPYFCPACRSTLRRALAEIDRLAYTLASWSDGHRGAASGEQISRRVAGPRTVSPIVELLDRLYGEVTDVEDEWRQYCGYLPVRRSGVRGSHNRSSAIAFISERLDDILAHADYTEFGHRVLRWERLLMAQTKSEPVTRRRPGRCPRCRMVSVLEVGDDDITKCQACGRWMNEDEYQRDVVHGADNAVAEDTRQARAAR